MGLVEIGALWEPRQSGKSIFVGNLKEPRNAEEKAAIVEIFKRAVAPGQEKPPRLVILPNDNRSGARSPVARIMADDGREDNRGSGSSGGGGWPPQPPPQPVYGRTNSAPPPQRREPPVFDDGPPARDAGRGSYYDEYANIPAPPPPDGLDW